MVHIFLYCHIFVFPFNGILSAPLYKVKPMSICFIKHPIILCFSASFVSTKWNWALIEKPHSVNKHIISWRLETQISPYRGCQLTKTNFFLYILSHSPSWVLRSEKSISRYYPFKRLALMILFFDRPAAWVLALAACWADVNIGESVLNFYPSHSQLPISLLHPIHFKTTESIVLVMEKDWEGVHFIYSTR